MKMRLMKMLQVVLALSVATLSVGAWAYAPERGFKNAAAAPARESLKAFRGRGDSVVPRKRSGGLESERPKRGERLEGREWRADDSGERPGAAERREVRRLQAACRIQLRGECEQRRLSARAVRSANRNGLD